MVQESSKNPYLSKGLEGLRKNNENRRLKASKEYDERLAVIGRVKRLEPYINRVTRILHLCIEHNEKHKASPNTTLSKTGGGLKCCRLAGLRAKANKIKSEASKVYDQKIRTFGKLKRLDTYIGNKKKIKHLCLIHNEIHLISPQEALVGKGLRCCRLANIQKHADKRKLKASKNYDKQLSKFGRVIRIEDYIDAKTPILHRCIEHGEEHKTMPTNARKGRGLICCKGDQGWDTLQNILEGKPLTRDPFEKTLIYMYRLKDYKEWFKIGITFDINKRIKEPFSDVLFGKEVGVWECSSRINAVLLETALLRNPYFKEPFKELIHLRGNVGFTEIRGGDENIIKNHIDIIFKSLEDNPDKWCSWAIDNISKLQKWEKSILEVFKIKNPYFQ